MNDRIAAAALGAAPAVPPAQALATALDGLAAEIARARAGDEAYFASQRGRYARCLQRLQALQPLPCRVLDIGSHYLHQSALLARLGFEVTGIDVPLFAEAPFIRQRAVDEGVRNMAVPSLEPGDFLPGEEGRYGLVVFTEILEHITFNPVRFWRRVHDLLCPGGRIYLSTPNSLRPVAFARELGGLLTGRGRGLALDEILGTVTYGHHWKEYSAGEIHRYFARLSDDFEVQTRWYSSDLDGPQGLKRQVKAALARIPCLRSDIEAVVRRQGQQAFSAAPPRLRFEEAR